MSPPTDAVLTDRDHALNWLVGAVPYIRFLGIRFDREGDQSTAHLPFQPMLIGNPMLPGFFGRSSTLKLATGDVSLSPYPSRMFTPYFASKAPITSTGIAAPPETQ